MPPAPMEKQPEDFFEGHPMFAEKETSTKESVEISELGREMSEYAKRHQAKDTPDSSWERKEFEYLLESLGVPDFARRSLMNKVAILEKKAYEEGQDSAITVSTLSDQGHWFSLGKQEKTAEILALIENGVGRIVSNSQKDYNQAQIANIVWEEMVKPTLLHAIQKL